MCIILCLNEKDSNGDYLAQLKAVGELPRKHDNGLLLRKLLDRIIELDDGLRLVLAERQPMPSRVRIRVLDRWNADDRFALAFTD